MIVLCKLVAQTSDSCGYTTYVFECLEDYMVKKSKYIMCTRWPNWDHRTINIGEIGYLNYDEIIAGKTTWYNSNLNIDVPYHYTNIQFNKFVEKPANIDYEYKM